MHAEKTWLTLSTACQSNCCFIFWAKLKGGTANSLKFLFLIRYLPPPPPPTPLRPSLTYLQRNNLWCSTLRCSISTRWSTIILQGGWFVPLGLAERLAEFELGVLRFQTQIFEPLSSKCFSNDIRRGEFPSFTFKSYDVLKLNFSETY